jgi:hypothetical protein
MGNLFAGDDVGVFYGIRQVIKTGAKDQADSWLVLGAIAYDGSRPFYLDAGKIIAAIYCRFPRLLPGGNKPGW